ALPTRAHSSVRPFLTRLAASLSRPFVFVAFPRPPIPTLFPYTTLFRSLFAAVLASAILPAHAQTEDAAARAAERARAEALEADRSEEHTSELQSRENLVCRLLLEKKKTQAGTGRVGPDQPSRARRRKCR